MILYILGVLCPILLFLGILIGKKTYKKVKVINYGDTNDFIQIHKLDMAINNEDGCTSFFIDKNGVHKIIWSGPFERLIGPGGYLHKITHQKHNYNLTNIVEHKEERARYLDKKLEEERKKLAEKEVLLLDT